ncbi:hypothetical protein LOD99_9416 [Oopsacas minuta]|uniref:WH1 domain-containing protein n=1 Tax=Oopsacas minuta TaxID=111878 RepID=A0AAV7JBW9_9METZ|nr:hypothetical protein LOD99_9416 [Oopsacas minuta]
MSEDERAVFKAFLFSGDTECRAWNLLYRVLIQLKFVSDGTSVKLLGIHEQKESFVYEISLQSNISVKMKSDFVQWHIKITDCIESMGAKFLTPSEADKFLSCFQQLLEDVKSRQQKLSRLSLDLQPVIIPHPSVRPSSALQLTVSLPDGRKRTESVSHSTRLREVLAKVCQAERLSLKYHYLKPEKLCLDPEPAPLDMELTVGEVKVSKLQLVDRRAERDNNNAGKISFLRAWSSGDSDKDSSKQVTLLNGTFRKFDQHVISDIASEGVEFVSPTRVISERLEGAERVESPIDSVDEAELAAPFRDVFRQELPKRSSSLRSRAQEETSLDKALFSDNLCSSIDTARPSSLSRITFSESDIREAFNHSEHKPGTPNRRRAPKPPKSLPKESENILDFLQEKSKKSSQVPLFKVPQEISSQLQDEFSQKLVAIRARSPDLTTQLNNKNAPLEPLASSTPDKKAIKPRPQIAPKPAHLVVSRIKQTEPSFPLYPSTPPTEALLTSDHGTCRGVSGRVAIWRAKEIGQTDQQQQQLVFRPQTSGLFESEPLVFNLPGPPPDSPPLTPPPMRFPTDCDTLSEPIELESLIPPPLDEFYQSDLLPSSPPSPHILKIESELISTDIDDDVITDIDQLNASDNIPEDMIVLPPPHFSTLSENEFVDYPPPSPLRLFLSPSYGLTESIDPPPPTHQSNYRVEPLETNDIVTDLDDKSAIPDLNTQRVAELLTAAANSLNKEGTDRPTEASELVRAALDLIARDSKKSVPEFLIRSSYHKSDEETEALQREAPDFTKFGQDFKACMKDIISDNPTVLRPSSDDVFRAREVVETDSNESQGSEAGDVVSAVAKAMKERRQQIENTISLSDPSHSSILDDWK